MAADVKMTKGERDDLLRLIKQRAKVGRAAAEQRSAALLAEFEQQVSAVYKFDRDTVWAEAVATATAAFEEANAKIKARCEELGIPEEFQPQLRMGWERRGENEFTNRRAELRRVAKAEIEALEKKALAKIEADSVNAQSQIIASGLTSQAAIEFLSSMPTVESLMPAVDLTRIEARLVEKQAKQGRIGYRYDA